MKKVAVNTRLFYSGKCDNDRDAPRADKAAGTLLQSWPSTVVHAARCWFNADD
jgi:hypothetical protein